MTRKTQVVLIGNSIASKTNRDIAYETGKIIGKSKVLLITGGRDGVMGEASRGANETCGLVLSIIPDTSLNAANEYSDFVIPTGIGYARNMVNVLSGDLIVAVGGASGTLSELAYAWQFGKEIFAYENDGWSGIIAKEGFRVDNNIDARQGSGKITPIASVKDFEKKYLAWLSSISLK